MKRVAMATLVDGPPVDYREYIRVREAMRAAGQYEVGSGRTPDEWQAADLLSRMWTRIRWLECELSTARKAAPQPAGKPRFRVRAAS